MKYLEIPCKGLRAKGLQLATTAVLIGVLPTLAFANPPTQPGQPSGSISGSTLTMSWAASSDSAGVAGYNVYINDRYITTVSGTNFSGSVDSSIANEVYVVAFDNRDSAGNRFFSPRSAEQSFSAATQTPAPAPITPTPSPTPPVASSGPIPTAPSAVNATRTSPTTVSVTWSPSTDDVGVVGYNVYRDDRYVTTVTNPRLNDVQLAAGVEYEYYVIAFDEPRNFSARSSVANTSGGSTIVAPPATTPPVTTPEPTPPVETPPVAAGPDTQRPAIVQGVQASLNNNGTISVTWNTGADNVGVDGYNVYRDNAYLTTVFTTSFTDLFVQTGQTPTYSVISFDAARNFSRSSASVAATGGNSPTPPATTPPVTSPVDTAANGNPPTLPNPNAAPIPSPNPADPYGFFLEVDTETPVAGGPPTQPKNVRAELISNDWAEINWAPSNDDGEVVEYRIYRSDGVVYIIRGDQVLSNASNQSEVDRFWRNTVFIDCNYTRFFQEIHDCSSFTPNPGDTFTYEVSAIDDQGQESPRSEPLEVVYHIEENAPVPLYNDFFKDDNFVSETDLSRVDFFLEDFVSVFEDEFDGTEINANFWNTGLVWGDTRIINGEQQYFVNPQQDPNFGYDPFNLTGDTLKIESIVTPEALKDNLPPVCDEVDPTGNERCLFLSGALSSHDKFGITYGYVESRMKVSGAAGALSSFYLYHRFPGTGLNRHAPEIDIIEYLGENPFGDELAFQTHHYNDIVDDTINSAPTMSYANPDGSRFDEDFHTYGVLWEPQLVIWYIDGREIRRMTGPQVGRQQMNIVAYLVSGSAWAPTPDVNADIFPLEFEIDYIKAYQRPPYNTNGLYPAQ